MNFRDLEYVIETSKTLSFSKAAQNCNVSQPSLSAQIKKLEDGLGASIFHRSKRSVNLTSYGEVFVEKAEKIIAIREEMKKLAKSNKNPIEGKLRVGGILTVAPYMFPKIARMLQDNAPKIKLQLKEAKTEALLKDLLDNRIDAAIISLPTDRHVFESKSLFNEDFYLTVSKAHTLAKKKEILDTDLESKELILLEEGHCFRSQALDVCHSTSAKENNMFTGTSLETIRNFVAQGGGITLLPAMALQDHNDITYIPMKNKKFKREIGIVWRKSCNKKPKIEKLIDFISDEF